MEVNGVHTVFQIIPAVLVLLVIAVAIVRHQAARKQQVQGIIWLQAMRMLLTHIQRHRGLSSGVLSGDQTLTSAFEGIQQQVSRDFIHIAAVGDWVLHHQGWQAITQHWARLAGNVATLPVARAIDQHNRLIKNILVFVDDIASAHHLAALSSSRSNIWREVLTLAEMVGQVRAIGTSLCAAGEVVGASPLDTAQKNLHALNAKILEMLEAPRCRNNLNPISLQSILNLLSYVDAHILQQGPVVSAKDYYREVTQTLDKLYEEFDHELNKVSRRLSR